ncbi:hypothetical protein [Echinicola sp. 20G]|uniref:hypothetical protein n=1 Tax=Echinicola sp. 20G TaxID=2781961 RepID=UPI001910EC19|nr:hypothetical protein [Echinicola sp. 20G]
MDGREPMAHGAPTPWRTRSYTTPESFRDTVLTDSYRYSLYLSAGMVDSEVGNV